MLHDFWLTLDRPRRAGFVGGIVLIVAMTAALAFWLLRTDYEELRQAGVPVSVLLRRRAVVKTTGRGLRKQHWDFLVVATNDPVNASGIEQGPPVRRPR